jgi:predicted type IV restriction endonuclease
MDFIDALRELSARIPKQVPHIQTEEATKNAMVMPFIGALGYNVFDPTEVTPELNADIGLKKGEKVDYAILKDGKPIMLFECKHHAADLAKEHASQLYRYFSVTEARFGVLTNGIVYWFYTDLDAPNKMDAKPFFQFNLLDIREQDVEELKKFSKATFDLNGVLSTATELKYTREIKRVIGEQFASPSDAFVKFFITELNPGKLSAAAREQFTHATQRALTSFVNDQINQRLKSALGNETRITPDAEPAPAKTEPTEASPLPRETISTTPEEMEGFYIVRAILREVVEAKRVIMRDVQTYCGILLDDNNRRPICRLWLNSGVKYLSLFDNEQRKETKIQIKGIDDLYDYADRLRATAAMYAGGKKDQG